MLCLRSSAGSSHWGSEFLNRKEDAHLASTPTQAVLLRSHLNVDTYVAARSFATQPSRRSNFIPFPRSVALFSSERQTYVSARSSQVPDAGVRRIGEIARKVARAVLSTAIACGLVLHGRSASATELAFAGGTSANAARNGTEILFSAWMGLASGCLHTLTGPDHLAALAPLSIGRTTFESLGVGALWGFGHDAGQVLFGILFLLLKDKLHIEILRTWGARVVALTLITIGVTGIKEAQEMSVPCLAGDSGSLPDTLSSSESLKGTRKKVGLTTFATGIVHGLQPDAMLMILPALALPSRFAGAAFLCMFLLGTVLAMGGYTAFIGSCSHALQRRSPKVRERLSWFASLVAIFVGAVILIGEVFGVAVF